MRLKMCFSIHIDFVFIRIKHLIVITVFPVDRRCKPILIVESLPDHFYHLKQCIRRKQIIMIHKCDPVSVRQCDRRICISRDPLIFGQTFILDPRICRCIFICNTLHQRRFRIRIFIPGSASIRKA